MKKRILWIVLIVAIVCFNFLPVNIAMAAGGNKQLIVGGYYDSQPSGSVANFNSLSGGFYWVTAANSYQVYQLASTAGVIRDLYIGMGSAAGVGKSYTFTVMVNGNPSDISVVITGATQKQNSDTVHTATVAAGDYLSLRCTPSGDPSGSNTPRWCSTFVGNTAGESLLLSQVYAQSTAINYGQISSGSSFDLLTTDLLAMQIIPTGGTIKNLYIKQNADAGTAAEDAYTYTLYKNGGATALTCTVTADDTTGNDIIHSVAVVAGDWVSMRIDAVNSPSASAAYTAMGMTFVATTAGQSILLGGSKDLPTASATEYNLITPPRGAQLWRAAESDAYQFSSSGFSLSNLYVKLSGTPSNAVTIKVRYAGTSDTGITVTIAETTGSDTVHSYNTVNYQYLNMAVVSGADTTKELHWGLVCTELPPPTVTTQAADNISYLSATLHGNITSIGSASPTIRGFAYGKTSGALDLDWHEHGTFAAETFSWATGDILDDDDTYYFEAYATNSVGTGTGAELTFDTLAYTAPTLDLLTIGTVTEATAVLNGNITGVDGDNATVRGVAYGEVSGAPNLDSNTHGSYGVGNYSVSLSGLDYDTLYFYKFYATNAGGTGYSAEGNFTTLLPLCLEPGNLTATQTGVGNITITWDMGLYAEDTIIRIGEDICPGNITDGYLVYNGNETTATYSGLSLGMHEYCIRAWSSNNSGNSTGYTEVKIGGTGMTALGNIILLGILMFASLACTISAYAFRKPPVAFLGAGLWALLGFFAFTLSTSPSPTQITDIYMGLFWLSMMMTIVSVFEPLIMKAPSIDEPEPEAELSQADQMKAEYAAMQKEMGVGIFKSVRRRRRLPRL